MTKTNPPRLHKPFYRNGPEHRDGADVSFQDIVKIFGFRTVKIGKWVTPHEQQLAANLFFDALCDLMEILAVPEAVISLNLSLSLAFGTGGQKSSSAHYDPQSKTLALAKNAGGGALAHEWFHAFDNYIASRMFEQTNSLSFASALWLDDNQQIPHPLNNYLSHCFRTLFLTNDGQEPHPYVLRSATADKSLGMYYYAQPQELAARGFEAVLQEQPRKNAFLVQGTKQSMEAKIGIYPDPEHRIGLTNAFFDYFHLLGKALDSAK